MHIARSLAGLGLLLASTAAHAEEVRPRFSLLGIGGTLATRELQGLMSVAQRNAERAVDPAKLDCAVCLIRPEHDGNASEAELYRFFETLATKDKEFVMLRGMTHGGGMVGSQRQRLWHVIHAFLSCPPEPSA